MLGTAIPTPGYEEVLLGGRKPADLPAGIDPLSRVSEFPSAPEMFLAGPGRVVERDPGRRSIGRRDFVAAHLRAGGTPIGHGFNQRNVASETAYGVYDIDGPVPVRVVLLDTTNMDGDFEGSIGRRQLRWLEERLIEAHAQYFDPRAASSLRASRTVWWYWPRTTASTRWSTNARSRPGRAGPPESDGPGAASRCCTGSATSYCG